MIFRDQGSGAPACHPERSAAESKDLKESACGKLNLTLEVLGKRPDGYHDLRMVMCSVELHDTVSIELGTGRNSCFCVPAETGDASVEGLPQGEGNLAFRAARAYFDAAGIDPHGFSIRIEKRVPTQAGMGGGSSDAAATLRALNRRFRAFSDEKLREIGLTLGSDVPYCLFGGTALAEGRGEILTRLPPLPPLGCVLVKPDFSAPTPALFAALDAQASHSTAQGDENAAHDVQRRMRAALEGRDASAIGQALSNDFTPVLAREHPVIEIVKTELLAHGARGSELTGTGAVVFGLFDDLPLAQAAAAALAGRYPFVAATYLLS